MLKSAGRPLGLGADNSTRSLDVLRLKYSGSLRRLRKVSASIVHTMEIQPQQTENAENSEICPQSLAPDKSAKQWTKERDFKTACSIASANPAASVQRFVKLAQENTDVVLKFVRMCMYEPIGVPGERRSLKEAAVHLVDKVLALKRNDAEALCLKGQLLLPPNIFSKTYSKKLASGLQEAYECFCKADSLGNIDAHFLRGKCLILMARSRNNQKVLREGLSCVEKAAKDGHAGAMVFLGQCLEFPRKFGFTSLEADEKRVIELYKKAAGLGNPDALNDMGTIYAEGLGGIQRDFDAAVNHYVRALDAGSIEAYGNIAEIFLKRANEKKGETKLFEKVKHYYLKGASMRSSKCAFELGKIHEEGLGDVVEPDILEAEGMYRHCIQLSIDDEDETIRIQAKRQLVSMYICRMKTNFPGRNCVGVTHSKLEQFLGKEGLAKTMKNTEERLLKAVQDEDEGSLCRLFGKANGNGVYQAARDLVNLAVTEKEFMSASIKSKLKHMFGVKYYDICEYCLDCRNKRRRSSLRNLQDERNLLSKIPQ